MECRVCTVVLMLQEYGHTRAGHGMGGESRWQRETSPIAPGIVQMAFVVQGEDPLGTESYAQGSYPFFTTGKW